MSPGLRVVRAIKAAGFEIKRQFSPTSGSVEVIKIIEQESGVLEMRAALENCIKSMEWAVQALEISPVSTFAENISAAHAALKKARGE